MAKRHRLPLGKSSSIGIDKRVCRQSSGRYLFAEQVYTGILTSFYYGNRIADWEGPVSDIRLQVREVRVIRRVAYRGMIIRTRFPATEKAPSKEGFLLDVIRQ